MNTTIKLKKFDIASVCKIVFFLDLILIVFLAIPITLMTILVPVQEPRSENFVFLPFIMLIIHPFMMTLFAAIITFFYNSIATKTGGIKVYIEE